MSRDIKIQMKKKAQMIKGLVNLLQDDADYICVDANDFDLIGLSESIPEVKETIQRLIDNVMELEYNLYLCQQKESL